MSACTNPRIGDKLHAYELRTLSEEENESFELHLLSCAYCFREASSFDGVARLLRSDPDVRQVLEPGTQPDVTMQGESVWARLRGYIWPDRPLFFRPAVAYFVVLLLAFPAYKGFVGRTDQQIGGVQSLIFTGGRSVLSTPAVIGEPLVVMLHIDGATPGSEYRIVIRSESGDIIFSNDHFTDLNEREMATILLSRTALGAGQYHIEVYAPGSDSPIHEYTFLAQ